MLYRRSPLHPPKLLLRVVATAGVGTLVGVAACSSGSSSAYSPVVGSAPVAPSDASDENAMIVGCEGFCGIAIEPDACDNPGCEPSGSVYVPPDAGESADGDAGPPSDADAGAAGDAASDASTDDGSTGPCHPVCGIIVHPDE